MITCKKLPNLFIIGVPKAGTTSLYNYLMCNEQVYFPPIKELHFFAKDHLNGRVPFCVDSWGDYKELFACAGDSSFIGEASVFYFYYHEYSIKNINQKLV